MWRRSHRLFLGGGGWGSSIPDPLILDLPEVAISPRREVEPSETENFLGSYFYIRSMITQKSAHRWLIDSSFNSQLT